MKVRTIIGANAYAHIQGDGYSMDVLLSAGHSAQHSLRANAAELRKKAEDCIMRASRMDAAADYMDAQP